jgi:hypothetical protein
LNANFSKCVNDATCKSDPEESGVEVNEDPVVECGEENEEVDHEEAEEGDFLDVEFYRSSPETLGQHLVSSKTHRRDYAEQNRYPGGKQPITRTEFVLGNHGV